MDSYVVYVLRSEFNRDLMYVGYTGNIKKRLSQHNGEISGGGEYTSENRPWKLAALIKTSSKSEALKVEYWAKAKNYPQTERNKIPTKNPVTRRVYLIIETMVKHNLTNVEFFDSDFIVSFKSQLNIS